MSLALHNSPDRLRLLLLDAGGEGVAFRGMETLPHLACPVARGPIESLASLRWALRTLARRGASSVDDDDSGELFFDDETGPSRKHADVNSSSTSETEMVILVDGVDSLLWGANRRMGANTEVITALTRLLGANDRAGIYSVVASERFDLGLNTEWGARITGPVASAEEARAVTGMKGSGAQNLLGQGDFLIALENELLRFQAAHISSAEVEKGVKLINSWLSIAPESLEEAAEELPVAVSAMPRPVQRPHDTPTPLRRAWVGD
jgi:DNA segregation ATPase FtsK/SpoIIIE-like protein